MHTSRPNPSFFIFAILLMISMIVLTFGSAPSVQAQDIETPTPTVQVIESATPTPEATATTAPEEINALSEVSPAADVDAQIVGGALAAEGEYPWQVALIGYNAPSNNFYDAAGYQFCGGTLIAAQWVLTAAHCVYGKTASSIDVVAGIYNLETPTLGYQRRDVILIIRHPSYNNTTTDNDVALLKLNLPVNMVVSGANATALIPMVAANVGDLSGTNAWATGWGDIDADPNVDDWPPQLREVSVPIISTVDCNTLYGAGTITNAMMCAGDTTNGGEDSCQGDSGGPLVINDAGTWKLAGIVSWGYDCGDVNYPGVYTRVSYFVNWINTNVYPTPSVPVLSLPASNALLTDYTPLLDWANTNPLADHYQIQIATDINFSAIIMDDTAALSTYTPVSDLTENTKYYWRVRAYNALGDTSNWSLARYFRTAILPPALNAPANSEALFNKRPTFEWFSVSGASTYTLQVSTVNTFASIAMTATTSGTSYIHTADLLPNKDYHWRVRANTVTGGNGPSGYSEVRTFHTANPPTTPLLVTPAINAITYNYTPALTWAKSILPLPLGSSSFAYYQIQVDDSSDFSSTLMDDSSKTSITDISISAPALTAGVVYYWRVRAANTVGADTYLSAWSPTRNLRAAILPPVLNNPTSGESLFNKRPIFDWSSVSGASTYTIQISLVNTCATIAVTGTTANTSYIPLADLTANKTYYWRVRTNTLVSGNGPSLYSECRSFTNANPPSTPLLTAPAANALLTNYTPYLDWGNSTLPLPLNSTSFYHYQVQVDNNSGFDSPEVDHAGQILIASSSFTSPSLAAATTFYWRVRAFNTNGHYSAWSLVRTFRTPFTAPALSAPLDNTVPPVGLRPVFSWSPLGGASGYSIQVSRNTGFTLLAASGNSVGTAYTPIVNLPADVPLYWRVRANGTYGPGAWSGYRTLTYVINPLGDTDGDSLKNGWEINGYDANNDGIIDVNLPALGANWRHKDIFVEMDYMVRPTGNINFAPNSTVMNTIMSTFANAPVPNPDGIDGINIHLDLSNQVTYDAALNYPAMSTVAAIKTANFASNRTKIYHYMLWADQYEWAAGKTTGSSGLGYQPGVNFIVTLGGWGTPGGTDNQKIGTFIHELGHNLGLKHGGADEINDKPNYLSVMNYLFQTIGIYHNGSVYFDYQRINTATINENSLNETLGINSPEANAQGYDTLYYCPNAVYSSWAPVTNAINWNCDSDTSDALVASDINADGRFSALVTQNNWQHIIFNGGGIIGSGLSQDDVSALAEILPMPNFVELTWEMQQKIDSLRAPTP